MRLAILIIILDFDWLHTLFDIYIYFHPENTIDDFMEYYRTEWPNGSIPPRLHILEDHATDFVEKWKTGFGMYGEQGGESIHNEFNQLKTTYCRMQPVSRRPESMLQEHYKRIHPESKVVKLKNKFCRKRKKTL